MNKEKAEYFERVIEAANQLHEEIYRLQNSGEVDEYTCSLYTMQADDFREALIEYRDKHL